MKLEYVFDTNVVARLLDSDPRIVARVAALEADTVDGLMVEDWLSVGTPGSPR